MGGFTQRPWTPTKRRGPIAAEFVTPGPGAVNLPNLFGGSTADSTKGRSPAFKFGNRPDIYKPSLGPAPNQYDVSKLSNRGKDEPPAPTLHIRPKDPQSFATPAPSAYNPEKSDRAVNDAAPAFSFGIRGSAGHAEATPAPNVYAIPPVFCQTKEGGKRQAPAYTIPGRGKDLTDDRALIPGPGTYGEAKADAYKEKAPTYSLSSRTILPSDDTLKPGPGAHSPEKPYYPPAHSFGIKHSQYSGVLRAHLR